MTTPPRIDVAENVRSTAYDMLDRHLRNSLGDTDYAEMSGALEALYSATQPPPTPASVPVVERELPPLPERNRRFFCSKCGSTTCKLGQEYRAHPECSDCGYCGFAEDADFTAEQMQAYARAALSSSPAPVQPVGEPDDLARKQAECDTITELNHAQWLALGAAGVLIAACNRLSAESEEYDFDDGLGRGVQQTYWDEFEQSLERATEAIEQANAAAQTIYATPQPATQPAPVQGEQDKEDAESFRWLVEQACKPMALITLGIWNVDGNLHKGVHASSPNQVYAAIRAARSTGGQSNG